MRLSKSFIVSKQQLSLLALSVAVLAQSPAPAEDWGYDPTEAPKKIEEQSAASMAKTLVPKTGAKTANVKPSAMKKPTTPVTVVPKTVLNREMKGDKNPEPEVGKTVDREKSENPGTHSGKSGAPNTVPVAHPFAGLNGNPANSVDAYIDKDQQSARCWVQLFQTCAKEKMDYVQQKQAEAYIVAKAHMGEKQTQEVRSILKFWPKLINDLRDKPDMEMHYADLFKALLRLHERTDTEKVNVPGSPYSSDADLIGQLLGLQRTAVAGDPSFSEDAVNAYADMAVFIYEQQHDGRTIDANDNRTLFAKVVVEKFNRAPTPADQRAMASFDLSWSKFKVLWFSSDASTRKLLLAKLMNTGANSSLSVRKDPLLEIVMANWPWKTMP